MLIGLGGDMLDLPLWWLGDWDIVDCRDDAMGGVAANCTLERRLQFGATGVAELSWNRNLRDISVSTMKQ